MATETRKAVLAFEVTGQQQLLGALQTLGTVESRLGQLAANARNVAAGGNPAQSADQYRQLFANNEQATRSFDSALKQTKTNTTQATSSMVADFQRLERVLNEYKALAERTFKAGDFPSKNLPQYTASGLPGSVVRAGGPGAGFYPVSQTGEQLSQIPFSSKPAAATAVQRDALASLEQELQTLLARVLGAASGGVELPNQRTAPPENLAARLQNLGAAMEASGRRVTATWEENGRTMVRWEREVNGRIQTGVASADLLSRLKAVPPVPTSPVVAPGGVGGVPPSYPRSGLGGAVPSGPDPVIREDLRRSIGAFLRSTFDPDTGILTDLKAFPDLGQRAEGEPVSADSPAGRALANAQITGQEADVRAAAKIDVQGMVSQVEEVVRTTGASYTRALESVYSQNAGRLQQQSPLYQKSVADEFGKLSGAAGSTTRQILALGSAAHRQEVLQAQVDAGGPGKYAAQFQQGFYGRREIPFAEQIGQVAKFSLLYGAAYQALFAFQQGLQAAVTETIDYNSAVIELSIATGRQTDEIGDFASDLGKAATAYGLSPGEGVRTGAAAIGIFGLQDAPFDLATSQTTAFTQAVGQVAFVTGRTAEQITQDLGAISQAFDLNASQSRLAQDLDAFFSKRFGSPAGGTLETVAQIGSLGKEAGFNQQEVTALASLIQSRTGQTPAATAGFLSQFFGRAGDPGLKQTFAGIGVDISKPFRDQIQELSKIMRKGDLGESLRLQIINAFGRGRSGQTAAIIAEQFPEINKGAKAAEDKAAGAGAQQLTERLRSVGGQLAALGGALKELAVSVGQSGLLDAFAVLVFVVKELVESANTVLGVFNALPRGIRDAIIAIGLLAIASRSAAVRGFVTSAIDTGRLAAAEQGIGLGSGLRGGASAFLNSGAGLFTIATAGLLAIGALKEQSDNFAKAMSAAGLSLTAIGEAETPDALRSAASSVRSEAATVRSSDGLFLNAITLDGASDAANHMADNLERSADLAERIADAEERRLEADARHLSVGVFQNPAVVDDVVTGLQQLDATGAGSVQQVDLLSRAIKSLGRDSQTAAGALRSFPETFTKGVLQAFDNEDLVKGLKNQLENIGSDPDWKAALEKAVTSGQPAPGDVNDFAGDFALSAIYSGKAPSGEFLSSLTDPSQGGVDLEGLQGRVKAFVKRKGELTGDTVNQLVNREMQNFNVSEVDGKALSPEAQKELRQAVRLYLRDRLQDLGKVTDPSRILSGPDVKQYLDEAITPKFDAASASLTAQGYGEGSDRQIALARQRVAAISNLRVTRSQRQQPDSYYSEQLRAAQVAFAQQQLARSQALREAQQQQAKGDAEVRRIGRRFFRRDVQTALDSGSSDLLKQVIANANRHQIDIVRGIIKETIETVKAKLEADAVMVSAIDRTAGLVDGTVNLVAKSQALVEKRLANLRDKLHMLGKASGTTVTSNQYNSPDSLDSTDEPTDTAAQIAAAQQAAEAARTDDATAQARAALAQASADLAAAKPGTVEYYSALQAYYEAQRALTDTIVETSSAARSAEAARTDDALAQARASLANAAASLATETPGTLAYYQALQAYREAQIALEDTIVEQENARILARASARGSAVVTATAELEAARNTLRNETEGTLAYYQALSAFNEAKRSLSEAIREQKFVQDQLAGDVTDPVDQAQAELRRARRQLRYDQRTNAGRDAIQADKLDVRQQEATVEQTKFDQWLSTLQTNEQLERIGHAQYIRTLERRIQRLRDVRHRTRQEQDELDQLLGVLQEAQKALSGQFNIGAIDIPSPYEARRYIEERRAQMDRELAGPGGGAGGTGPAGGVTNNDNRNFVTIDGADTGMIKRLIIDLLGRPAIHTHSTATGKR